MVQYPGFHFGECDLEPIGVFVRVRFHGILEVQEIFKAEILYFFGIGLYGSIMNTGEHMVVFMLREAVVERRPVCEGEDLL
jgi:hypothetical protein